MSNSSPSHANDRIAGVESPASIQRGAQLVAAPVRFVGFWLAVALPFLYVPLLVGGLTGEQATVFAGLLSLNVVALLVGHGHRN